MMTWTAPDLTELDIQLTAKAPEPTKKNMQMKECGKAHLGSPALMLCEDGYFFKD